LAILVTATAAPVVAWRFGALSVQQQPTQNASICRFQERAIDISLGGYWGKIPFNL